VHELGIACEILDVVLAEAEKRGAAKVSSVSLRVGVLRAVEPENLSFLFGELSRGTAAEGARVEIEPEPLRVVCPGCGPVEAGSFTVTCPRCGETGVAVSGGESLFIESFELNL
jgi:hydrogenase nickel incorporation protein HypA/HybF